MSVINETPQAEVQDSGKVIGWLDKLLALEQRYGVAKILVGIIMLFFMITLTTVAFNPTIIVNAIEKVQQKAHNEGMQKRLAADPIIRSNLAELRLALGASRTFVLETHNGGTNLTNLPFLYIDMTYEDLVEYFGAEGQFDKEEYSEHMKANYRYYRWISDQDPNTFIYINLKEKDGVYKVSGFNSSGFTATQAKDQYLAVLQEEEKEKSKAAAANMKMNDVTMELKTFGSGGIPLNVKVQIPEKEWSQEVKNGTGKIYNTEDLSKTFGVGFIQLKVDKDIAKFDFYKDKFENYKEIEPRVIGGVEMQGRTYKNIGYEWTEYIGQANDELAISIGIVRVDIDDGTLGDKILDSISFE